MGYADLWWWLVQSVLGRPWRNSTGGRGCGLAFLGHHGESRATWRRCGSCTHDMDSKQRSRGIVVAAAGGGDPLVLGTTGLGGQGWGVGRHQWLLLLLLVLLGGSRIVGDNADMDPGCQGNDHRVRGRWWRLGYHSFVVVDGWYRWSVRH